MVAASEKLLLVSDSVRPELFSSLDVHVESCGHHSCYYALLLFCFQSTWTTYSSHVQVISTYSIFSIVQWINHKNKFSIQLLDPLTAKASWKFWTLGPTKTQFLTSFMTSQIYTCRKLSGQAPRMICWKMMRLEYLHVWNNLHNTDKRQRSRCCCSLMQKTTVSASVIICLMNFRTAISSAVSHSIALCRVKNNVNCLLS